MPKSPKEKQEFARDLLQKGISYTQIQDEMKNRYGTGMSNSTLQRLILESDRIQELENRLKEVTFEAKMYKKLYYELLDAVKEKIQD